MRVVITRAAPDSSAICGGGWRGRRDRAGRSSASFQDGKEGDDELGRAASRQRAMGAPGWTRERRWWARRLAAVLSWA